MTNVTGRRIKETVFVFRPGYLREDFVPARNESVMRKEIDDGSVDLA